MNHIVWIHTNILYTYFYLLVYIFSWDQADYIIQAAKNIIFGLGVQRIVDDPWSVRTSPHGSARMWFAD